MCVAHLAGVVGHAGAPRLLVGALLVGAEIPRSETLESITIDLPPGSFTITSGRSTRPSSPATDCCSSKSQYGEHPGHLDHAPQLDLAPATACV